MEGLDLEPDNARTVVVFQNTTIENALTESCVNEFVNEIELTKVLDFT